MTGHFFRRGAVAFTAFFLFLNGAGAQEEELPQNAVLEGMQVSAEKTEVPYETSVTCYFIFIDKPSSYFYEIKRKPNRLVFEFNDTKKGTAPIPNIQEPPILGFTLEEERANIYKDIRGYSPEYHDVLRVRFNLANIPEVTVTDEYNVITFRYKWTNDPSRIKKYAVADNTAKIFLLSSGSLTAIGGGVLAYWWYVIHKGPEEKPEISLGDMPLRPSNPTAGQ
jgi:hypothetical protein